MAGRTPSNSSPFSPELQTFVVTKYDPLLAIVRELNARLQAAEKGMVAGPAVAVAGIAVAGSLRSCSYCLALPKMVVGFG